MKAVKHLSAKMIPALDSKSRKSEIADIGLVPAVRVEIKYADQSVSAIGVIDTGADISILDESLFRVLAAEKARTKQVLLEGPSGRTYVSIYTLNVKIMGSKKGEQMDFENVPVAVENLRRPVLIIGRRGILERLRVELDFPRAQVNLVFSRRGAATYPHLAREFPHFESALQSIEAQRNREGIMMLSWDMERFLNRLMTSDEELRGVVDADEVPLRRWTLGKLLLAVCQGKRIGGLGSDINEFTMTRDKAAHAPIFGDVEKLSTDVVLEAAERIVSRLSAK